MAILSYLGSKWNINIRFPYASLTPLTYRLMIILWYLFFFFWCSLILASSYYMTLGMEFSACAVMFSSKEFGAMESLLIKDLKIRAVWPVQRCSQYTVGSMEQVNQVRSRLNSILRMIIWAAEGRARAGKVVRRALPVSGTEGEGIAAWGSVDAQPARDAKG